MTKVNMIVAVQRSFFACCLLFLINCHVVNSILFPRFRCYLRFGLLRYDVLNYERYPIYFRDDSTLSLAQTGTWTGTADIEEYVRFASDNPIFKVYVAETVDTIFEGYDEETGNCVFLSMVEANRETDTELVSIDAKFSSLAMIKLNFNLKENYIRDSFVYFTKDFIGFFFNSILADEKNQATICSIIDGPCKSIIPQPSDCKAELATRSSSEGDIYYGDSDTIACRAIHSFLASTNPENHCAHIALEPTEGTSDAFRLIGAASKNF